MTDAQVIGYVFFGSIVVCTLVYWAVSALLDWVDRHSPITRADRRQLRSVQNGKRAQGFKSRVPQ